jgi:hypothetical protein
MFTPKAQHRIAVLAFVAESLSLWMFSLVPLDIGFAPDANPWFDFSGAWPCFFTTRRWSGSAFCGVPSAPRVWWLSAFIVGYVDFALAAAAVYSGVVIGRRFYRLTRETTSR